jgi:hypothetical protein
VAELQTTEDQLAYYAEQLEILHYKCNRGQKLQACRNNIVSYGACTPDNELPILKILRGPFVDPIDSASELLEEAEKMDFYTDIEVRLDGDERSMYEDAIIPSECPSIEEGGYADEVPDDQEERREAFRVSFCEAYACLNLLTEMQRQRKATAGSPHGPGVWLGGLWVEVYHPQTDVDGDLAQFNSIIIERASTDHTKLLDPNINSLQGGPAAGEANPASLTSFTKEVTYHLQAWRTERNFSLRGGQNLTKHS